MTQLDREYLGVIAILDWNSNLNIGILSEEHDIESLAAVDKEAVREQLVELNYDISMMEADHAKLKMEASGTIVADDKTVDLFAKEGGYRNPAMSHSLILSLSGVRELADVEIDIQGTVGIVLRSAPCFIQLSESSISIPRITSKYTHKIGIYQTDNPPHLTTLDVIITYYEGNKKVRKHTILTVEVPIESLGYYTISSVPTEFPQHSLTVETVNMSNFTSTGALYPEIACSSDESVVFTFSSGSSVYVFNGSKSGTYSITSSDISGIWKVLENFIERVKDHCTDDDGQEGNLFYFGDLIPMREFEQECHKVD